MLFDKKFQLTENQFNRLSNIFDGAGQIVFGVAVITPLIQGFANFDPHLILLALLVALFCWYISVVLAKKE